MMLVMSILLILSIFHILSVYRYLYVFYTRYPGLHIRWIAVKAVAVFIVTVAVPVPAVIPLGGRRQQRRLLGTSHSSQ